MEDINSVIETIDETCLDIIRCRGFHLTYATHFELDEILKHLEGLTKTKIEEYSLVNEIGKTGHKHCHCYIKYKNQLKCKTDFFDFKNNHPNIAFVNTDTYRHNVLNYHHKERNAIVLTNIEDINKHFIQQHRIDIITACKSWSEVMLKSELQDWLCRSMGYAKELYNITRNFKHNCGGDPAKWMKPFHYEILKIVGGTPSFRHVYWFTDSKGGVGKTRFAKHLANEFDGFLSKATTLNDFAFGYKNHCHKTKVLLFDLPRGANTNELYNIIECCLDGVVNCNKYESTILNFSTPHIIVFSNEKPNKGHLSEDRIIQYIIDERGNFTKDNCLNSKSKQNQDFDETTLDRFVKDL